MFIKYFPENHVFYEIILKKLWYSRTGHRWQYNAAHAFCMLHNWVYKHTLRVCNTYRFSTAKMVTLTRLNVTLYVHYLSCYIYRGGKSDVPKVSSVHASCC